MARRAHGSRPCPPTSRAASLLLLPLLAVAAAASPQQERSFREVIDIEIVDVDVWVSDRRGEPVHGLASSDFEVLHDGRPIELTHFREIRDGRAIATGEVAGGAPAAALGPVDEGVASPTHVVVYFDQTRLRPANYAPLIQALRSLLASGSVAPERVLLLRQRRGLAVEQPFGSSRAELEAALARIESSPAPGFDADTETRLAVEAIRETWDRIQDDVGTARRSIAAIPTVTPGAPPGSAGASPRDVTGGFGSSAGPDACGHFVSQIQPILGSWARSRSEAIAVTLGNLGNAASFLAGIPGVKLLLYLSDGLEARPGTDLANYAAGLCPAGSSDLLNSVRSTSMNDRFLELTRHANSNRVTIHALQTTGLRGSQLADASSGRQAGSGRAPRATRSFESSRRSVEREGLGVLAAETGGRAIFDRNELDGELGRIGLDARNYYSLAYKPPSGSSGGGREHRIEVRVRGDGTTARYRRGYVEKDAERWLGERVEGALNLGITDNRLGVKLAAASAQPGAEGAFEVPLHVIVPAQRLAFLPRGKDHVARVSIKVMARAAASNTLSVWDKQFQVKGAPGSSGWADLVIGLDLPAGAYVTAVGVRDEVTGEASFLSTTLQSGPAS